MKTYPDAVYGDYHNINVEEVYEQIEELTRYANLPLAIEEKIAHYQAILLNRKLAMDYRHEAVSQLAYLMKDYHTQVIPVLINFLESGESEYTDPNYILNKVSYSFDQDEIDSLYGDENYFSDVLSNAISAFQAEIPETKAALPILLKYLIELPYSECIDAVIKVLYVLGEKYQDVRFILTSKLYEERDLNTPARLLLDYLDEYYNQLDPFEKDYFSDLNYIKIDSRER